MDMEELRFCQYCMSRTIHRIVDVEKALENPRGRTIYECTRCHRRSSRRRLRPSSEISY